MLRPYHSATLERASRATWVNMRNLYLVFPFVMVSAFLAHGVVAQNAQDTTQSVKLQFSALPEKHEYRLGEVVRFRFSLHNSGDRDVLVARGFTLDHYVYLRILGPDGKELPWCGKIDGIIQRFAVLRPGAKIQSVVRASCDSHRDSGYVFDRQGVYNISAYYHLPEPLRALKRIAGSALVTTARIHAKPVSITITSPRP